MNTLRRTLSLILLVALAACKGTGVDSADNKSAPTNPAAVTTRYPLTGTVVAVVPERHTLLIAHEAIEGLMPAMTMEYAVDDATLKAATKDARITGELVREGDGLKLEKVKFGPAAAP
jgi:Cu/Ag efflux protein CusF